MTIKIEKISSGFAAKFPYELKGQFRAAFPSAKWNSYDKQWEVGPRSGKRLEQWMATVQQSGVLEDIETRDFNLLAENELDKLNGQLQELKEVIKEQIDRQRNSDLLKKAMEESKIELDAAKQELADEKKKADKAEAAANEEMKKARDILNTYINFPAVIQAQKEMISVANKVGRNAREKWDAAQAIIKVEREKLKSAGLISRGISALAFANHNRPDRDHPNSVNIAKILTISKIENEDS